MNKASQFFANKISRIIEQVKYLAEKFQALRKSERIINVPTTSETDVRNSYTRQLFYSGTNGNKK